MCIKYSYIDDNNDPLVHCSAYAYEYIEHEQRVLSIREFTFIQFSIILRSFHIVQYALAI